MDDTFGLPDKAGAGERSRKRRPCSWRGARNPHHLALEQHCSVLRKHQVPQRRSAATSSPVRVSSLGPLCTQFTQSPRVPGCGCSRVPSLSSKHGQCGAADACGGRGALPTCQCAPPAAERHLHLLASSVCQACFRVRLGWCGEFREFPETGRALIWVFLCVCAFGGVWVGLGYDDGFCVCVAFL